MKKLIVDLLRHGSCEGGDIFRGSTDVALNNDGEIQMRAALSKLSRNVEYDTVVSSPFRRCSLLATKYAEEIQAVFSIEPDFREYHFGDWEGQNISSIWSEFPDFMLSWYENPEHKTPPNAERYTDFSERVRSAFSQVLVSRLTENDASILIVSHAGVIRELLSKVLELPLSSLHRFAVPYACMTRIEVWLKEDGRSLDFHLVAHNLNGLGSASE